MSFLTILMIAIIIFLVLAILIVGLARKSSQTTDAATAVKQESLSPEQAQSLKTANSELVNVRMILSRIENSGIRSAGNEACGAIEKVLQTLKEKPEKIQTTRQLFNYYLPTLEKVLSKYQRIEASKVENPEMAEKVTSYLSDVHTAMDNLYEGLYDNDKLHVNVDIEAMTIAIKRDGLLDEEDFTVRSDSQAQDTRKTPEMAPTPAKAAATATGAASATGVSSAAAAAPATTTAAASGTGVSSAAAAASAAATATERQKS